MTVATRSRRTDSGTVLKFGPKYNESSSTWGTWSAAATSRARVVFPDPVLPMIRIRLHPSRLVEGSRRVEVIGSIITARAIERGIVFDRPPGGLESAQLSYEAGGRAPVRLRTSSVQLIVAADWKRARRSADRRDPSCRGLARSARPTRRVRSLTNSHGTRRPNAGYASRCRGVN